MTDAPTNDPAYQVLARKYRPQSFDDLLGHGAMVRTLRNAFAANRIAHAFVLTGVRGVGKTTTARIMARALNFETDEINTPTVDTPIEGLHCRAIAESRHPDVIEMDAASRTGVGDIRELIEGVRYAPVEGRYKVYIIDEVHMLSNSAFNALLKTLEEPPPHVKFIFATTEIRKVPVTVLSRCQRFDLRRFDAETLSNHLKVIAGKEDAQITDEALLMIARAAEGSVRDGLSLLDQAIIQFTGEAVNAEQVRDMLGLVDRTQSWDLETAALGGNAKAALDLFRDQYNSGATPSAVLRDLLDITHLLTRVNAAGPEAAAHGIAGEADADRARALANQFSLPALTRVWSLLMKALEETMAAPDPAAAAEIGLIRIAYAAALPTPEEALKKLGPPQSSTSASSGSKPAHSPPPLSSGGPAAAAIRPDPRYQATQHQPTASPAPRAITLAEVAAIAAEHREAVLHTQIETCLIPVRIEWGRIDVAVTADAPSDLTGNLMKSLRGWTGDPWLVSVVPNPGDIKTLRKTRDDKIRNNPLVRAALDNFTNAKVIGIRPMDEAPKKSN